MEGRRRNGAGPRGLRIGHEGNCTRVARGRQGLFGAKLLLLLPPDPAAAGEVRRRGLRTCYCVLYFTSTKKLLQLPLVGKALPAIQKPW